VSSELEQAGALVTAGLAAAEIDRASLGARHAPSTEAACLNCGAALAGRFCSACGQAAHLHRSLLHLIEELGHNVLHFDAKGWRTLPLLAVHPGRLTRRYIDGERTRYVSPLALFLFTGFLMFFIVSLTVVHVHAPAADPTARAAAHVELAADAENAGKQVERAAAALAEARRTGVAIESAQEAVNDAQQEQRVAETAQRWVDAAMAGAASSAAPEATPAAPDGEAGSMTRALAVWAGKIDTGHARIDALLRHALQNPELFFYRLENTAYKYLFLLIPISLPFLWLMFIGRRDVAVYDHAVFSLYSLSFMSLLIVACSLLGLLGLSTLAALLLIFTPPLHMFLQLRETYRLGLLASVWRTIMLLGVAGTAFLLFTLLILALSLR
jgi:hypothetical protein